MIRKKSMILRRCSIVAFGLCSGLFSTGCIRAAGDAAGAGALNFIQDSVLTVLSTVLFGASATSNVDEMGMDGMSMDDGMMSGGEHDGHTG